MTTRQAGFLLAKGLAAWMALKVTHGFVYVGRGLYEQWRTNLQASRIDPYGMSDVTTMSVLATVGPLVLVAILVLLLWTGAKRFGFDDEGKTIELPPLAFVAATFRGVALFVGAMSLGEVVRLTITLISHMTASAASRPQDFVDWAGWYPAAVQLAAAGLLLVYAVDIARWALNVEHGLGVQR